MKNMKTIGLSDRMGRSESKKTKDDSAIRYEGAPHARLRWSAAALDALRNQRWSRNSVITCCNLANSGIGKVTRARSHSPETRSVSTRSRIARILWVCTGPRGWSDRSKCRVHRPDRGTDGKPVVDIKCVVNMSLTNSGEHYRYGRVRACVIFPSGRVSCKQLSE